MPEFQQSWSRAWSCIGATTDGNSIYAALLAAYREPQRKYHTLQHLGECLALFDANRGLASRPEEVELGLWFHDAVYEVKDSNNEERSAEWARAVVIGSGAAAAVAERIYSLVMVTRHAGVPAKPDEQLLVDIDLAILGASEQRFAEYEHQIREEYAYVPEVLFNERRGSILRSFLDRKRIFGTPHFHAELEALARTNLTLALAKHVA
jgi:predicted metal-dependent HD superfamily phosphohydrolase